MDVKYSRVDEGKGKDCQVFKVEIGNENRVVREFLIQCASVEDAYNISALISILSWYPKLSHKISNTEK